MKTEAKFPPSAEWDFRRIDNLALPNATLYEYARSTEGLRARVVAWLETKIKRQTVRQHLFAAAKVKSDSPDLIDRVPAKVAQEITNEGHAARIPTELLLLIMEKRPDFPRPWLKFPLKHERNSKFSRILCTPLVQTIANAKECFDNDADTLAFLERSSQRSYHLRIDWRGNTLKDIKADLARWAGQEARNHPERASRGKPSQRPIEPLKWLAAWRLKEAGLTFTQAQDLVDFYAEPTSPYRNAAIASGLNHLPQTVPSKATSGKREMLPRFGGPGEWSKVIAKANRNLEAVESADLRFIRFD